jgi:hypothetical protein
VGRHRDFIGIDAYPKLLIVADPFESRFKAKRQEHDRRSVAPLLDQDLRRELGEELVDKHTDGLFASVEILSLLRDPLTQLVEIASGIFDRLARFCQLIDLALQLAYIRSEAVSLLCQISFPPLHGPQLFL